MSFKMEKELKKHSRTHLKPIITQIKKKDKKRKCQLCNEEFDDFRKMQTHLMKHTEFVPFKCEVCSKEFPFKNQLVNHSLTHRLKSFKCQICTQVFAQRNDLVQHIKTHSIESLFSCKVCEKEFINSSLLESHMQIHKDSMQIFKLQDLNTLIVPKRGS